jgi:hypothetical protein
MRKTSTVGSIALAGYDDIFNLGTPCNGETITEIALAEPGGNTNLRPMEGKDFTNHCLMEFCGFMQNSIRRKCFDVREIPSRDNA